VADQSERTAREREEARLERERRRAQRLGQSTSEHGAVSPQNSEGRAPTGEPPERAAADADDGVGHVESSVPGRDGNGHAGSAAPRVDGDGHVGPYAPDRAGGGNFDSYAPDQAGGGNFDSYAPDQAADGNFDSYAPDRDGDGHVDSYASDRDGGGPVDSYASDRDGDGHVDSPTFQSDDLADEPIGDHEVPLGIRRATHRDRLGNPGRRDRARVGRRRDRPRVTRRRESPQASGRRSWAGRAMSLVALALGVVVLWFLIELFQPFSGQGHGSVTVTIPAHSGASQIGAQLEREGVISSSFFFNLRVLLAGDRGSLLSGTYHLQQGMSYSAVLRLLTTPQPAAKVTNVTLIEGRTRSQIDKLLHAQGVAGSYLADTRRSPLLDLRRYGAPAGTPSLEGFLFPSTYELRSPISIPALVTDQLQTFRQVFAHVNLRYAQSKHLTPYDVLIIASMVQAESQTSHDNPLVASVIYNRLAAGMPLQIDATTRYATGNYSHPLTQSELNSPSPYNTRIHPGLPPTPIDNPGLAAMRAAAHPAITNDLYFIVKVCGHGEQVFTGSYSKFLNYVAQYQAAQARNGGRSPANC
jgi:UPF0755 protein